MALNGFKNEADLTTAIQSLQTTVNRMRNKMLGVEEPEEPKEIPVFPLADVPDVQLTEDQKKEKRKQRMMRANWEARLKARAEKEALRLEQVSYD